MLNGLTTVPVGEAAANRLSAAGSLVTSVPGTTQAAPRGGHQLQRFIRRGCRPIRAVDPQNRQRHQHTAETKLGLPTGVIPFRW